MKRSPTVWLALAVLLLVVAAGTWFVFRWIDADKTSLNIGLNIWPGYGAFFIAERKGMFDQEGVSVRLHIIQGDPEREASLVSGKLDAIGMTVDNLVVLRNGGIDVRAVYKYDSSAGADGIVARKELRSLADLKGKKVGWAPGSTSHFFLAVALKRVGLRTTDLDNIALSADDAGAAFAAGHLDAAATWEPWLSKAQEGGKGKVLLTTRELPIIEDVLFFRGDVLAARRDEVKRLVRACFRAVEYWKAHPDEAVEIISKKLGIPPADVQAMLGGIKVLDQADNNQFFGDGTATSPAGKAYSLAMRTWIEEGVIAKAQDAGPAIDHTIVSAVDKASK